MRALVTGITGFVGSHLLEHLLSRGDQVLGCSRHARFPDSLADSEPFRSVPLIKWDVSEPAEPEVFGQLRDFAPQVIYHLAAISVPRECGESEPTESAVAANVLGTERVLELARQLAEPPLFLLASSCYVYAAVSPESPRVAEDAPLGPSTGYGHTKLAAEQRVQEAAQRGQVRGVVARAFHHTGPRQSSKMMLPEWISQMVKSDDQPVRVLRLDSHLDMTDVRDVVRAYRLLVVEGAAGGIYNVGSSRSRRSGDMLERLFQLCGQRRAIEELSPQRRQHPIADITRLQNETGWHPEIPFDQTLLDTWDYWKAQEHSG